MTERLMQRASRVMPEISAIGPRHSDIVFYDNMGSIFNAAHWRYKGSPLNSAAVWNTGRSSVFARYVGQYAHKTRNEWSYTFLEAGYVQADIYPYHVSGSIQGYTSPPVRASDPTSGGFQLYGTPALNGTNGVNDVSGPPDLTRLLGPSAIANTTPNMAGVADQAQAQSYGATRAFNGVHHDNPTELQSSQYYYGSFSARLEAGFVPAGQSSGFSYSTYLKGVYADQAAYNAARNIGAVPYYAEYGTHLMTICLDYLRNKCLPRCREFGLSFSTNGYNSLPSEHTQVGLMALKHADYGVSELVPFYWVITLDANAKTDRLYAEDFAVPQRWRATLACASYIMLTASGYGKRNAVAFHPPIEWVPQPSSANGPPPVTAWAIGPKIRTQQRTLCAMALACGNSPVVPLGVYDLFLGYPAAFPAYSGYTGLNAPQWSGPVDDYADFFQWIAKSSDVLDGFVASPTVLLAEPLTSTIMTGSTYGASRVYDRTVNTLDPLMSARVPYAIASVGGYFNRRSLSEYDTSNVLAVVKMSSDGTYTSNYGAVPVGTNVITQATLMAGDLTKYAPVAVTGERDTSYPLLVIPRVRSADRLAMTLHCINTDAVDFAAGAGVHHESGKPPGVYRSARSGLVVTLKPWAWLTGMRPRVTWWSPEAAMQGNDLSALVTSTGLEIRLPALLEYGVVLLEFS